MTIEKTSHKEIITLVAILAVLVTCMVVGLHNFEGESRGVEAVISHASAKVPNNLEMHMKLTSIDPIRGDVAMRVEFLPKGNLVGPTHELTHDITVFLPTANGKTEFEFKKGKHMAPIDVTVGLFDGYASDYPFDNYETLFDVYADMVTGDKATAAENTAELPVVVSLAGSIPGYQIAIEKNTENNATWVEATVHIKRSIAVVAFSTFVMLLMWGLSISVLLMVIVLLFRKQKIEIGLFGFMSALLFAFYGLRNGQPSIPPIGVYSDFVAFFWAEILVAVSLLVTALTWVFRMNKSNP